MYLLFGTVANKKKTLNNLLNVLHSSLEECENIPITHHGIEYDDNVEKYISEIENDIKVMLPSNKQYLSRWVCLKLLDENIPIIDALKESLDIDLSNNSALQEKISEIKDNFENDGITFSSLRDSVVLSIISRAEYVRKETCIFSNSKYADRNRKIDKILTSKTFGIPIMLLFFALIFWITIALANYPSSLLSTFFAFFQDKLVLLFEYLGFPDFLTNMLVYRNVSDCNMGCFCYASSNGNIFPFIYIARRLRIFAENCV